MSRPIEELPGYIDEVIDTLKEILFQTANSVKERLAEEGEPIRYPVQWDSERQRRAFFATNGFGQGIPYRRTQKMILGIKTERVPLGANLRIPHPGGAVLGLPSGWQSRIHRNRWAHTLTVLFEELAKIPSQISNRLSVRGD